MAEVKGEIGKGLASVKARLVDAYSLEEEAGGEKDIVFSAARILYVFEKAVEGFDSEEICCVLDDFEVVFDSLFEAYVLLITSADDRARLQEACVSIYLQMARALGVRLKELNAEVILRGLEAGIENLEETARELRTAEVRERMNAEIAAAGEGALGEEGDVVGCFD